MECIVVYATGVYS